MSDCGCLSLAGGVDRSLCEVHALRERLGRAESAAMRVSAHARYVESLVDGMQRDASLGLAFPGLGRRERRRVVGRLRGLLEGLRAQRAAEFQEWDGEAAIAFALAEMRRLAGGVP